METRRILFAAAYFVACLAAFPAHADIHLVQIEEIMAGANNNPEIQFIELTMLGPRENCQQSGFMTDDPDLDDGFGCERADPSFSATRLFFFDSSGTPLGNPEGFPFPHNTPIAGENRSILIGTQAFADLPTTPQPDFIIPAMLARDSGRICYSLCLIECQGFSSANDCLSYGAFTGEPEGFGTPAAALPITGAVSLRRVNNTGNNATDFTLSTPAPCNNSGACAAADVSVAQSDLIGPVPVGDELAYVFTVTNAGPALATDVTLEDTLPSGSRFVFAAAEAATCSQAEGRVSCGLGDLEAGQSRTAIVALTPTLPETLRNTATVSSPTPDTNPTNNTAVQETTLSCVSAGIQTLSGRIKRDRKGLARVSVRLRGTGGCLATATTDRRGNFAFAGIADGDYTVEPQRERSCSFKPRRRQVTIQGAAARARFTARCR